MNIEDIEIGKEYFHKPTKNVVSVLTKLGKHSVVISDGFKPCTISPIYLRPKTLNDCTPEEWDKASKEAEGLKAVEEANKPFPQDQQSLEAYYEAIPEDKTAHVTEKIQRELREAEEKKRLEEELTGWSSGYYELPEGAKELQDLIEAKNMNFAIGNIFKACYRLGNKRGTSTIYDLKKILWYVQRELDRVGEGDD